jgi:flagellar biosynthesis protein FliP
MSKSRQAKGLSMIKWIGLLSIAVLSLFAPEVSADNTLMSAVKVTTNADGSQEYSITIQILLLMTLLTFLPAIIITMTSFTRIVIVFGLLKQAMGTQQAPSSQVIIGLSLFLTFFIMTPVINKINDNAIQPYINESITSIEAFERAKQPLKDFMLYQTRMSDLELFVKMSEFDQFEKPEDIPFHIVVPAFITSELKTAFQIGFLLYLPFLVIDIVIASVLMSMGMMMLSPMMISLPFKLMLFVLVDGWVLIAGSLAASFGL